MIETLPFKLGDEEIKELEQTGRVEIMSYGDDRRYFAIVDKALYHHTNGEYTLLEKDFEKGPTASSQ